MGFFGFAFAESLHILNAFSAFIFGFVEMSGCLSIAAGFYGAKDILDFNHQSTLFILKTQAIPQKSTKKANEDNHVS